MMFWSKYVGMRVKFSKLAFSKLQSKDNAFKLLPKIATLSPVVFPPYILRSITNLGPKTVFQISKYSQTRLYSNKLPIFSCQPNFGHLLASMKATGIICTALVVTLLAEDMQMANDSYAFADILLHPNDGLNSGESGVLQTHYLIIGVSTAAQVAWQRIRKLHPDAHCTVVVPDIMALKDVPAIAFHGVSLIVGQKIKKLDIEGHTLALHPNQRDGEGGVAAVQYSACLLAQGGQQLSSIKSHHFGPGAEIESNMVIDCSRRSGSEAARNALLAKVRSQEVKHVTIVGGGWIGVELACQIKAANRRSTVVLTCSESAPLARYLPKFLKNEVRSRLSKMGIQLKGFSLLAYIYPTSNTSEIDKDSISKDRKTTKETVAEWIDNDIEMFSNESELHLKFGAGLKEGDNVKIINLVNFPEFNGQEGRIVGKGIADTLVVELHDGAFFDVYANNLRRCDNTNSSRSNDENNNNQEKYNDHAKDMKLSESEIEAKTKIKRIPNSHAERLLDPAKGSRVTLTNLAKRKDLNDASGRVLGKVDG